MIHVHLIKFPLTETIVDGHVEPRILSRPNVFRSHIGSDVRLPCNVTKLSGELRDTFIKKKV